MPQSTCLLRPSVINTSMYNMAVVLPIIPNTPLCPKINPNLMNIRILKMFNVVGTNTPENVPNFFVPPDPVRPLDLLRSGFWSAAIRAAASDVGCSSGNL